MDIRQIDRAPPPRLQVALCGAGSWDDYPRLPQTGRWSVGSLITPPRIATGNTMAKELLCALAWFTKERIDSKAAEEPCIVSELSTAVGRI